MLGSRRGHLEARLRAVDAEQLDRRGIAEQHVIFVVGAAGAHNLRFAGTVSQCCLVRRQRRRHRWRPHHRSDLPMAMLSPRRRMPARRAWHAGHGRLPRRLARDRAAHSIIIWSNKSKPYYLVVLPKFIIIVQLEIIAGAVGERDCKADDQMMSTASSHWHCSSQPSVGPTCTSPGGQPEGSI